MIASILRSVNRFADKIRVRDFSGEFSPKSWAQRLFAAMLFLRFRRLRRQGHRRDHAGRVAQLKPRLLT